MRTCESAVACLRGMSRKRENRGTQTAPPPTPTALAAAAKTSVKTSATWWKCEGVSCGSGKGAGRRGGGGKGGTDIEGGKGKGGIERERKKSVHVPRFANPIRQARKHRYRYRWIGVFFGGRGGQVRPWEGLAKGADASEGKEPRRRGDLTTSVAVVLVGPRDLVACGLSRRHEGNGDATTESQ